MFQRFGSDRNLLSLSRQTSLFSYTSDSGALMHPPPFYPPHLRSHHTIHHRPHPSPHGARPRCLPLTLAQAAALLPGSIGVPEELLRFVFDGDVKRVSHIWVVKFPHRQHLRNTWERPFISAEYYNLCMKLDRKKSLKRYINLPG